MSNNKINLQAQRYEKAFNAFQSAIVLLLLVASRPRCYNQSDPQLNSTAWFAVYIGPFMPFLTLEVFQSFGSAQVLTLSVTFWPLRNYFLEDGSVSLTVNVVAVSMQYLQVFTVNPANIALLNHSILPVNLTNYYTELIYQEDSNFNPML